MEEKNHNQQDDYLLQSLLYLSEIEYRRISRTVIIAGLPLKQGRLTPDLFPRAAKRAGFDAKVEKKSLKDITAIAYTYILILREGHAYLLWDIDRDNQIAVVIDPKTRESKEIGLEDLSNEYTGTLIEVQPESIDERATPFRKKEEGNIFLKEILRHKGSYVHVVISSFLTNLFVFITPLFLMLIYDRVVPNSAYSTLWVLAFGAFVFFSFDFIIRTLRNYYVDKIGSAIDEAITIKLFQHVLNIRMAHKPVSVGSFANIFNEFELLREFLTSATLVTIIDVPFIILLLIVIWILAGWVVLLPFIGITIIIVITLLVEAPTRKAVNRLLRNSTQRHAVLVEALSALESVKTLNLQGRMQRQWEDVIDVTEKTSSVTTFYTSLAMNLTTWVQQIVIISVGVAGAYMIIAGHLSIGGLIATTILASRSTMVNQIIHLLTRYERARTGLRTFNQIMKLPREETPGKQYVSLVRLKGDIELEEVNFMYPDRTIPVLKDISCKIQAGEKVGIVGGIGSGKTTLLKLVIGLYIPTSGNIYIDDVDTSEIHPAELRRQIHYASRESSLMYGSLRDNVLISNPNAPEEVFLKAVKISGVEQFAKAHPLGYDMPVGGFRANLSTGQKQAIILARALVANPAIYLFDEPTAGIDNQLELQFLQHAPEFFKDKTVLIATHRLSVLELVDRIIVLGNYKILADGKRDEILKVLVQPQKPANNK